MFGKKGKFETKPVQAPKARTKEEVGAEFNNIAFKAGHTQYQIHQSTKELAALNATLVVLEIEYKNAEAKEKALAAAEAAEKAAKESKSDASLS